MPSRGLVWQESGEGFQVGEPHVQRPEGKSVGCTGSSQVLCWGHPGAMAASEAGVESRLPPSVREEWTVGGCKAVQTGVWGTGGGRVRLGGA